MEDFLEEPHLLNWVWKGELEGVKEHVVGGRHSQQEETIG